LGYQTASYGSPRQLPLKSTVSQFTASTPKSIYLELNKGDMVQHTAFGRGMVLSVMKMGGDALLEIVFDDIGTKKLMA
jgi:DNA helicase-2/ATP-dependent DNA helicase PcrA